MLAAFLVGINGRQGSSSPHFFFSYSIQVANIQIQSLEGLQAAAKVPPKDPAVIWPVSRDPTYPINRVKSSLF